MNERSNLISKLKSDFKARTAYIQAKVGTLVPSQIRALRLKSEMPRQPDLACAAEMHQSRISMLETPGANPTLNTLSSIAAALKVGLVVKFVPFSEMLDWENKFSQDRFKVTKIDEDQTFLNPVTVPTTAQSLAPVDATAVANAASWSAGMTAFYRPTQPVSPPTCDLLTVRSQAGQNMDTSLITSQLAQDMLEPANLWPKGVTFYWDDPTRPKPEHKWSQWAAQWDAETVAQPQYGQN